MQFHFDAKQSQFHKNGFALRLALKQRHKGTRKWPIVIVKHSMALHPRSSKANQGRPKEGKGCPCSNPGNCLRVMFSFLGGYQLSQSYLMHSFPIPPVVVNASGVNELCSASNTLLEYNRFLSFSWMR